MDLGQKLQQLEARLTKVERSARLSHAAIDDTAVEVRDGDGNLRGLLGVQSDGTTAVNIVNGAAPPAPSTPTVAPALGGIAVGWDGTFADGVATPLDWSRVEVHTSTDSAFTATPDTLQATIETPQGGISYIPVTAPTYVRLLARNTSGTASDATASVGPYSPTPVAGEIGIGDITETMISDGAVTTPKLFANAVTTPKLAAGSVDAVAIAADAITGKTITGGTITGAVIQTAGSGQRITLNESAANKILVYDASRAVAELSALGLALLGSGGGKLIMDPNNVYPNLRLTNAAQTNEAVINVSEGTPGAADLGLNSGKFSASGFDWKWRTYFGGDFWVAERIRDSAPSTHVGGRVGLTATSAIIGYSDSTGATTESNLSFFAGTAQLVGGRLEIVPAASASSALYVNGASGYTGNLLRLLLNGVEKFAVDKDGNLTVAGIGQRQPKRRTSDATKTSNTTLATDTQLTFTVDAGGVYDLDGYLKYSGPGDFQMGWTFPSGTLGEWSGIGNGTTVISSNNSNAIQQDVSTSWGYTVRTESTDIASARTYGGIGTSVFTVHVKGTVRVGATGGTFALQWAQGTSNATSTTLYTDSRLSLTRSA